MKKMFFVAVIAVLLVSGCSDKDEAAPGKTETSMLEKAEESTRGAMSDIKGAASEAMDNAGKMASDTKTAVSSAAGSAMHSASEMASETKTAVTAAAGNAMESAREMASDASEAVTEMTADDDEGDADMDDAAGQQVYMDRCQSCHAMGIAGAPKLGDKAAWAPRIAMGMDVLYASVINGKNIMPPRGACPSCSDDDLKVAVDYMVSQSE